MPYITLNTQKIYYAENTFDTEAPAVIFLHGAGSRSQDWPLLWQENRFVRSTTVQRWMTDFPLYMLDLPGHGRSDLPGRTNIEAYADDVLSFVQSLGLKKVVVAGLSMGGAIAQTIALRHPAQLAGVILIGTGAHMPVSDVILDGLLSNFEETIGMIVKFAWHREAASNFKQVATEHLMSTAPAVVHGDFFACNAFDVRNRLSEMDVPTLVIGGAKDKMMSPEYSQFLAEHIPNATLAIIEDAGHYMVFEKTTKVTRVIVEFLKRL